MAGAPGRGAVPGLAYDRGPVGGPVPAGGARRDGRPVVPAAVPARPARRGGPSGGSSACGSRRLGPARIAWRLGLHASTVHAVLARYGCPPLAHLDRAAGVPVRRYERERPGELVHVDIKKLGNIPDGGGHRARGRAQGRRNKQATATGRRRNRPLIGYGYLHTALDDHSRLAYTEILADEKQETAAAFLARAPPGMPPPGSPSSASSPTTAAVTGQRPGPPPAGNWTSPTSAPAPTGPRPTAR